ncbi:MAG TPA: toxin-antitoxin system YwqK family antitoxin [Bacteroidia bacterium]|nr:toxin-antitoxin system YwqK family antitoxin [Bacteroidia bacterium]
MKLLITFILFLSCALTACNGHQNEIQENPKVIVKDKKISSDFLINGVKKEYYKNGKLERETPYTNGKKNGTEKFYYESGELYSESPFTDDKANGVCKVYYKSGKLLSEAPYSNGIENGLDKSYYENGKLMEETPYVNGKQGLEKQFDENGNEIKQ